MEQYSLIYRYFGLDISEQMELDTLTFSTLLRDAFVMRLKETEDGRDYLERCWRYGQTEPDRKSLREQFSERQ